MLCQPPYGDCYITGAGRPYTQTHGSGAPCHLGCGCSALSFPTPLAPWEA